MPLPPDQSFEAAEIFLLDRFDDPNLDEALRPGIILALGEIGSSLTLERLLDILQNRQEEKPWITGQTYFRWELYCMR